jgi:hypothetical protein
MAVLLQRSRIIPVDSLLEGLRRVSNSIVRVSLHEAIGVCTGWFITPDIVIIPGFVAGSAKDSYGSIRIENMAGNETGWSTEAVGPPEVLGPEIVGHGETIGTVVGVALLHVSEKQPDRTLQLSFENPAEGDEIRIVHYPGTPEACISFGKVLGVEGGNLIYDADTLAGSSGAPVLDSLWRVVAFHAGGDFKLKQNFGPSRPTFLKALQESKSWAAIASFHRIADDRSAQNSLRMGAAQADSTAPEAALIRAALTPGFDRSSLSDDDAAALVGLVADPRGSKWVLRAAERRRIIASTGSLANLSQHFVPSEHPDEAERVVRNILAGPPYEFEKDDEASLAWWIQAVRWFEGLAPDLPTPAAISRVLERRRIRSRLDKITDGEFRGRVAQLDLLRRWYKEGNGPVVLSGIGGIGKSSVVARFASELPAETLLLWLDFDRADLAPDDAASVLSAISDQASLQLDSFVLPKTEGDEWMPRAESVGAGIAAAITPSFAPLVVLDSFEAAQYSTRYQEIWPVLETISRHLPNLKVCVTGRAPVPGLKLLGKTASPIELRGIDPSDARQWLRDKGITIPAVLDRVVELAGGIPLIIRLALRLIEVGGQVQDLPRDLPQKIVAGYLYDRILDRVQNPEFKQLASAFLVVRRITVDMFMPLFEGLVDLPPGEPSDWFAELSREMGLVEGGEALQARPEVRAATLSLLERENPALVRSIDERAVTWYAANNAASIENAAELVYHNLRLDNIAGAETAWREGAGAFLMFAADDIRGAKARAWLLGRLGAAPDSNDVTLWEQEAAERIRAARKRGLDRTVKEILRERPDRSPGSPLVFQEAFELFREGLTQEASSSLYGAGGALGAVARDRIALQALLARERGAPRLADNMLAAIDGPDAWNEGGESQLKVLAVQASRIRLSVDLDEEVRMIEHPDSASWNRVRQMLSAIDVLSPVLRESISRDDFSLESMAEFFDLAKDPSGTSLAERVERERTNTPYGDPRIQIGLGRGLVDEWSPNDMWKPPLEYRNLGPLMESDVPSIGLALASRRRWWLAEKASFLRSCCEQFSRKSKPTFSPLAPAILGTLALFASGTPAFSLAYEGIPLSEIVLLSEIAGRQLRIPEHAWQRAIRMMKVGVDPNHNWTASGRSERGWVTVSMKSLLDYRSKGPRGSERNVPLFLLFLASPDPLDVLVADLAGSTEFDA